jgi:hypothetical protein
VFKGFAESECERRLFWDLGQGNPQWASPFREPVKPEFHRNLALQLGHDYEQKVYRALVHLPETRAARGRDGKVVASQLTPASLTPGLLLEHEWSPPPAFYARILGLPAGSPLPCAGASLRPDLLLVQARTGPAQELLPGGELKDVAPDDTRLMLRIYDIKHTSPHKVGRGHFAELLFYAHALSFWLAEHGLTSTHFVPAGPHGILPVLTADELVGLHLARFTDELSVPMHWEHTRILFEGACDQIRRLVAGLPLAPDQVPVRIQPGCRSCSYLDDCVVSLQRGTQDPGAWDFRLLPHTSPSIAELLAREGLSTIRDIAEKLPIFPDHDHYDPLYAERPLLRLKARAVMTGQRIHATLDQLGQRQYSMALPRQSEVSLFFDVEADPSNDVIFGAALRLEAWCSPRAAWAPLHEAWWACWRDLIAEGLSPAALKQRLPELKAALGAPSESEPLIDEAARAIREMSQQGSFSFPTPRDGQPQRVTWTWSYVSDGLDPEREIALAHETLGQVHACVTLCKALEALLVAKVERDGQAWDTRPSLAIYYWSAEQVEAVRDMLERSYLALNLHQEAMQHFRDLLHWLAPTESQVTHFDHHLKFFDLRAFVETTQGLPHLINTTWHALLQSESGRSVSSQYWAPHFNLMDFGVWHAALDDGNATRRLKKFQEISEQLQIKLSALSSLLLTLRRDGQELLTLSRGVATSKLAEPPIGVPLHPLAQVFYMYSRLNAAAQVIETNEVRLSYPSRGIGRLKAAELAAIERLPAPDDKMALVRFRLEGMSSGVRLRENDRVLLMPESSRGSGKIWDWEAVIESMSWESDARRYVCEATISPASAQALLDAQLIESVYLYPTSKDYWSGRLLDTKDALLRRHGGRMGRSWLGSRAAALLGVDGNQPLPPPPSLHFSTPELYYYAPGLLPETPLPPGDPLRTTASPPPDDSQREAILRSLSRRVTCLQGPPGTGKSQTIAALIDEHLQRSQGPFRILVTAFSYDALLVLARKLHEHQDTRQDPTLAASVQMVFAKSKERELDLPPGVQTLELTPKTMDLDGVRLERSGQRRLTDYLPPQFILFANAYSLCNLGTPSETKKNQYELLPNDFGFDLIIVDEASQLPTDYFLAAAVLVHPGQGELSFTQGEPDWKDPDLGKLTAMKLDNPGVLRSRIVVVGDQHQLPPVQPVEPPRKLRKVLGSFFHYLLEGHHLDAWQLGVNYRSTDTIVEYTRQLALYSHLVAWHKEHPHAALPPPPPGLPSWLAAILDPAREVHALIHERQDERVSSPLEARLVAEAVVAFHRQLAPADAAQEEKFWKEEIGVVAPHNAQGRLILRLVRERFAQSPGQLKIDEVQLDKLLRQSIYSVEKFQGSDRTFIIASMGISARDQISAEEGFIYGLNRFNVLTSRAKQKLLLVCSRPFLSHIPADRELLGNAALIRGYALDFCDQGAPVTVENESGQPETIERRWRVSP